MPFCTNCGKEVFENDVFCSNCGTKLESTNAEEHYAPEILETVEIREPALEAAEQICSPEHEEIPVIPVSEEHFKCEKKKFNVCALIGLILAGISLSLFWMSLLDLVYIIPAAVLVAIAFAKSKKGGKGLAVAAAVVLALAVLLCAATTVLFYQLVTSGEVIYFEDSENGYTPDEDPFDFDKYKGFFDGFVDGGFEDESGEDTVAEEEMTELEYVYSAYCDDGFAILSDDGDYLVIDTNPEDEKGYVDYDALGAIEEINGYLSLPDSLMAEIKSTRSIDGMQTRELGEYTVSWTYHPGSGIEIRYEHN